ncbi:hypothetical protein ABIB48_002227 [Arthrobacter sp. UYCu511]|uniref:PIN-like domain-containing protein n=1 Tax=Arthrobacter sp. UYCu511 TaxID=3156337 RepID=UPI003394250B
MKFFIDENISPRLAEPLGVIYKGHEFGTATTEGTASILDEDLFPLIRSRGYDAIITKDGQQLRRDTERRAIFDQGLHWIGYKMKAQPGVLGFAIESSTIVAGLAYFFADVRQEPHAYEVKGMTTEPGQRIKTSPLWIPSWK